MFSNDFVGVSIISPSNELECLPCCCDSICDTFSIELGGSIVVGKISEIFKTGFLSFAGVELIGLRF